MHLPYWIGALLIALLAGPPGVFLAAYVETMDGGKSFARTILLFGGSTVPAIGTVSLFLLLVLLFYAICMVRFIRGRVLRAEEDLAPLLPEGEESFHRVFSDISGRWPPMVLTAVLAVVVVGGNFQSLYSYVGGPVSLIELVFSYSVWLFVFSTFVCVYLAAIRGLNKLGSLPLKLKPFHEDPMLGVRPLGSLALSFSIVYFFALGILAIGALLSGGPVDPIYASLLAVLTLVGIIFFFLPLEATHTRMVAEKKRELAAMRARFTELLSDSKSITGDASESQPQRTEDLLRHLAGLIAFEMTRSEVRSIPTWPFDTSMLSRFAAVLLSVTAILLAKLIAVPAIV